MTSRRPLLIALGAAAFSPRTVLAQFKQAPVVIGSLNTGSRKNDAHLSAAFKEGLAALGWKEASNYVLEERWADGRVDRLQALAEELAAKKPALIVAAPGSAVAAAAKATTNIPVVQATGSSPVSAGLAASLARPGGMVTGLTNVVADLSEKYLELLIGAAPKLRRVGFLVDSTGTPRAEYIEAARRSAARYAVEAHFSYVAGPTELAPAFAQLATKGVQGLVLLPAAWFPTDRHNIVNLALERRWPVIAGPPEFAEAGALLVYGVNRVASFRRAAYYVDRILKGARPGDLPIEQPTRFELVVNMKTAKALGITIPQSILVRADRAIE